MVNLCEVCRKKECNSTCSFFKSIEAEINQNLSHSNHTTDRNINNAINQNISHDDSVEHIFSNKIKGSGEEDSLCTNYICNIKENHPALPNTHSKSTKFTKTMKFNKYMFDTLNTTDDAFFETASTSSSYSTCLSTYMRFIGGEDKLNGIEKINIPNKLNPNKQKNQNNSKEERNSIDNSSISKKENVSDEINSSIETNVVSQNEDTVFREHNKNELVDHDCTKEKQINNVNTTINQIVSKRKKYTKKAKKDKQGHIKNSMSKTKQIRDYARTEDFNSFNETVDTNKFAHTTEAIVGANLETEKCTKSLSNNSFAETCNIASYASNLSTIEPEKSTNMDDNYTEQEKDKSENTKSNRNNTSNISSRKKQNVEKSEENIVKKSKRSRIIEISSSDTDSIFIDITETNTEKVKFRFQKTNVFVDLYESEQKKDSFINNVLEIKFALQNKLKVYRDLKLKDLGMYSGFYIAIDKIMVPSSRDDLILHCEKMITTLENEIQRVDDNLIEYFEQLKNI